MAFDGGSGRARRESLVPSSQRTSSSSGQYRLKPRVMVVDDDVSAARQIALALEIVGLDAETAQDSDEALAALAEGVEPGSTWCSSSSCSHGEAVSSSRVQLRKRFPDLRIMLTGAYHLSEASSRAPAVTRSHSSETVRALGRRRFVRQKLVLWNQKSALDKSGFRARNLMDRDACRSAEFDLPLDRVAQYPSCGARASSGSSSSAKTARPSVAGYDLADFCRPTVWSSSTTRAFCPRGSSRRKTRAVVSKYFFVQQSSRHAFHRRERRAARTRKFGERSGKHRRRSASGSTCASSVRRKAVRRRVHFTCVFSDARATTGSRSRRLHDGKAQRPRCDSRIPAACAPAVHQT